MSRKARLLTRLLSLLAVIIPTSVILTPQPASAGTCYQMSNGYWVCNAIMNKYFGLGGWNWAYPVTNETGTSDGIGAYNHFNEWVSGRPSTASIYWTEATGTWKVNGAIRDKWGWMGWERSPLGYPTGDESDPAYTPITQRFQNGMIVFTPERGALEVHGAIAHVWIDLGYFWSVGLPQTDERGTPDGVGRYNHFDNGSIYWHPSWGAFPIPNPIRDRWASLGWEQGSLGYPQGFPYQDGDYLITQNFVGGYITCVNEPGGYCSYYVY
ncbi:hypothetical protein OG216_35325 [Streptomycetaceae bacterium NBC_01309]